MSDRVVHFEIPFSEVRGRVSSTGLHQWGDDRPFRRCVRCSVVTVEVEDVDAALARIEALGGTVVIGRTAVGDMGYSAYYRDTEGNVMGLWESGPRD